MNRGALAGSYAATFGMTGTLAAFLPPYLKAHGMSATQVGALLAVPTAAMLIAPGGWAALADRSGQPARVLQLVAAGAALTLLPLLWVRGFAGFAAALLCYGAFATAITALLDALALAHCAVTGRSYAALRLCGSLGYAVAALGHGLLVARAGAITIALAAGWAAVFAAVTLLLRSPSSPSSSSTTIRPRPLDGLRLLRRPALALLLAATCLHWIAYAPQLGLFAIHVEALGLRPWVVGASFGAGVAAELVAMALHPRLARRAGPLALLAVAMIAGALRWVLLAEARSASALIGIALLHGLTFGTFYLAALAALARQVPAQLRASGQALFVSVTFGLGGLFGLALAGRLYDALGGAHLFHVAAALEAGAVLLLCLAPRRTLEPSASPAPSSEQPSSSSPALAALRPGDA